MLACYANSTVGFYFSFLSHVFTLGDRRVSRGIREEADLSPASPRPHYESTR